MKTENSLRSIRSRLGSWPALPLFLLLAFAVYHPAIPGEFLWDDDDYVSENPLLGDLDGLERIWTAAETPQYYPMVFTSFWVEHQLWGLNPSGYHAVNILLHAINAFLVGCILRALRVRGAWWVAVLFAVHPVHVESVAWISERKNVLSALFYLLALLSYLRFQRDGGRRFYAAGLVFFLGALLSKTVTSTLPLVILIVLWYQGGKVRRADVIRLVPFFALALFMGLVTVTLESGMVDAVRADFQLSGAQRVLVACQALFFYAWKLIVPHPVTFNYPRWEIDAADWTSYGPVAAVLVLAALVVYLWRRGQRGVVSAVLFFAVTLFPALGLFDVYPFRYSFVADHFQYLASLGILILVVQAAGRIFDAVAAERIGAGDAGDVGPRGRVPVTRCTIAVLVAIGLALLSWSQTRAYRSLDSLWNDTIAKNPDSWLAHHNLGSLHLDRGEYAPALARFERALEIKPGSAESHTGRGLALARLGRPGPAVAEFDRAVELDPGYTKAYINRGQLLLELGQPGRSAEDFTRVLRANPGYAEGYRFRALGRAGAGRYEEAISDLTEAIRLGAGHEAYSDRGAILLQTGRFEAALADFELAIGLSPDPLGIYHNRGVALFRLERYEEALADFDRVLEGDPAALKTYLVRGTLYQGVLGNDERACADWRRACGLGDCRYFESFCSSGPKDRISVP